MSAPENERPEAPQPWPAHAPWLFLGRYFKGQGRGVALAAALGLVQSIAVLPTLLLARRLFNVVIPKGQISLIIAIGLGLIALRIATSAVALFTRALSLRLTKRAISDLRIDLLTSLYGLPRDFFGQNDAARVQTRIVMETERLDNLVSTLLSTTLPALLATAGLCLVLVYLNPWLTLMMACLAPLVWLATAVAGRWIRREVKAFQGAFERFSQGVQFVLRQMELTRTRGYEAAELDRQAAQVRELETSGVKMAMSYALSSQLQANLTGVGGLLLLIGGGVAVARGDMKIGDLLAFYLAAGLLNTYLNSITGVIPDLIAGNQSLGKLLALKGETPDAAYLGQKSVAFQERLSLENLSFGFDAAPLLLENLSLDLAPGQVTAIFGPNGAGKSTLINLILGFYRPSNGRLLIDGVDYDEIDVRSLRRAIGVAPQRPTFFTATIADNITYGWPQIEASALSRALHLAGADRFIESLPAGLATLIGEGGARLSGGEAQKLAIARALIAEPRLLILDEPTNHLDLAAIKEIMGRIARMPDRPAVLIISHDATVMSICDRVFALKDRTLEAVNVQDFSEDAA